MCIIFCSLFHSVHDCYFQQKILKLCILLVCVTLVLYVLANHQNAKLLLDEVDLKIKKTNTRKPVELKPNVDWETIIGATYGTLRSGQKIRKFPNTKHILSKQHLQHLLNLKTERTLNCNKWGVLTTIKLPSEAVRQFLFLSKWCLVVVGDRKTPNEYHIFSSRPANMYFISLNDQKNFIPSFVSLIPEDNFGRKNIGYLFAIMHGANIIWDFDDNNFLKFWLEGAATDSDIWIETITSNIPDTINITMVRKRQESLFFNPYQYLGSPGPSCWPRGFPLSEVKKFIHKRR